MKLSTFTDDTKVLAVRNTIEKTIAKLQNVIDNVNTWIR